MKVAVAGLGFMGATHLQAWKKVSGAQVTAVVSSDAKKLSGDLTDVGGNLGIKVEPMDFSKVKKCNTFEEALVDPEIDAVDLCLPTDQHAPMAIAALRAGKHVLLEKPMGIDETETNNILREAEASGRTLMIGQVLRFFPGYVALAKVLPNAGTLRSATFQRQCGAPTWSRWLSDPQRGGGVFDLLVHDVDYCIARWGMPETIRATGHEDLALGIDLVSAELQYTGSGPVTIVGGWRPGRYPFSMQFSVTTDQGTYEWSSAVAPNEFSEYKADGAVERHLLSDIDPFADELQYFTDCVSKSQAPHLCPPRQSAEAVSLMRQILAARKHNGESIPCKR